MTIERASDIILKLRESDPIAAVDLFAHFDEHFHLSDRDASGCHIRLFAQLCGYEQASSLRTANP